MVPFVIPLYVSEARLIAATAWLEAAPAPTPDPIIMLSLMRCVTSIHTFADSQGTVTHTAFNVPGINKLFPRDINSYREPIEVELKL